jgi:hypothetical protein
MTPREPGLTQIGNSSFHFRRARWARRGVLLNGGGRRRGWVLAVADEARQQLYRNREDQSRVVLARHLGESLQST